MATDRVIAVRRIRTGSVFRLMAAGIFFSFVPFTLLMGVFALMGLNTFQLNDQPIYGLKGLLVSPLIGVCIAAVFTAIGGVVMAFGLWLYSKWKPLRITVSEDETSTRAA